MGNFADHCDTGPLVQRTEQRTDQQTLDGRLEEGTWDDADNAAPLDLSRFDSKTPGRMGYAMLCDDGVHPDIAPYRLTAGAWL